MPECQAAASLFFVTLEPMLQAANDLLQTGSSLGAGNAAMAKDAADESIAHPHSDPAKEVLHQSRIVPSCLHIHPPCCHHHRHPVHVAGCWVSMPAVDQAHMQ